MSAEPIAVSLFDDVFSRSIRLESMMLEQLAELIRSVTKPFKPQLPLLKLSRFGSTAVPHTGSYRHDQNLVACSGIEGDYDGEVVSFDEALEKLIKANISAILCTSPSYAPERPRWRVLCPFSTELPPSGRPRMVGRLNGALHGVLAPESWTLSQAFYYGSVNDNPNHRVEIIDGDPIDLLSDLDLIARGKPSGAGPKPNGHDRGGGPVDEGSLAQEIVSGTNYHVAGMRLIGLWAHQGVPLMEVERRLIELFDNVEEAKRDHRWRDRRADVERCVGDVFLTEAQKQDDADAELAGIQAAVAALVENDPGTAALIERITAANLPPLVEGPLIKTIKRRTAIGASAIDKTLKDAKQKLKRAVKAASQPTTSWAALVSRFESDEIRPTMSNVALVIRNEPSWNGTLWLDEFSLSITVQRPLPWDDPAKFRPRCWTDDDELAATEWMQRVAEIYSVPRTIVFDGVSLVAGEHRFHPVRDYLDSLVWDSKPRTDSWLTYYLGAESADPRYLAAVGSRSLIQAVARIYKPGIKADCCLLIDGEQGLRKSMALRMLFDPLDQGWFADEISDLGSKDANMQLRGKWCIEFAELSALRRSDVERTKSFLSRTFDHYRPPYGRVVIDVKRQNVFAGTTNDDEVLRDPTGNRRYWPFLSGAIDTEALWNDRHMLWAEAVHRFRIEERWWIAEPELIAIAEGEQAKYQETDAWDPAIADYIRKLSPAKRSDGVTTADVLSYALQIDDKAKWDRAKQMRVGACLRKLGWAPRQQREAGVPVRRYFPPHKE